MQLNKNNILKKIKCFQIIDGIINFKHIKPILNYINNYELKIEDGYVNINDLNKKALRYFVFSEPKNAEVTKFFLDSKIKIVNENFSFKEVNENEVILVCLVKDDYKKITQLIPYYRKLGIHYFCFIDNCSSDGTYEYLLNQLDVNLYLTEEKYSTQKREGWMNRIYNYIGYNKWILCIDSDELFTFINQEKNDISKLVKKLNYLDVKRARCLLLDMYSKENLFSENTPNLFEKIKYFDSVGYETVESHRCFFINGGPRKRLFSNDKEILNCTVSKYPLFYFEKGDFQGSSHWSFPYKKNGEELIGVIRHYKFMKDDFSKYKQRVIEKNYSNGSLEYQKYISVVENNKNISFYYSESNEYKNSNDLKKICVSNKNIIDVFKR